MNLAVERINEIFTVPRELSLADIESFMINVRLVLESNKLQEQYKILNLYCNWSVHSELSESITAHRILEQITESFIAHNINPENSTWVNDAVLEGLQFHKLQYDIVDFGFRFGVNLILFENERFWKIFGMGLIDLLQERPLNLNVKRNKLKEIRNSIAQKGLAANQDYSTATSLRFIYLEDKQHYEISTGINGASSFKILGPVYFVSQEEFKKANKRY